MTRYSPKIERHMRNYYDTLPENDRRRYAGIEAMKLGRGGLGRAQCARARGAANVGAAPRPM